MRFLTSRTPRGRGRKAVEVGNGLADAGHHSGGRRGGPWEDFYRRHWQRLKAVRSTYGATGTASCSSGVSIKGGISIPEPQKDDLPTTYPHFPDDGPSGCPRQAFGLAARLPARQASPASNADIGHFYARLPARCPSLRGKLLDFWREAQRGAEGDSGAMWEAVRPGPRKVWGLLARTRQGRLCALLGEGGGTDGGLVRFRHPHARPAFSAHPASGLTVSVTVCVCCWRSHPAPGLAGGELRLGRSRSDQTRGQQGQGRRR